VFKVYNKRFEHLEQSMKQLRRKRIPWEKHMLNALEAGRLKLDEYYSQTDNVRGHIYAVNTMPAPVNKFQFFLTDDWDQKGATLIANPFKKLSLHTRIAFLILKARKEALKWKSD
jgi:hypothetical protein